MVAYRMTPSRTPGRVLVRYSDDSTIGAHRFECRSDATNFVALTPKRKKVKGCYVVDDEVEVWVGWVLPAGVGEEERCLDERRDAISPQAAEKE